MNEKKFEEWLGKKAYISREVKGKVTVYAGLVSTINMELIPDNKIVQLWRTTRWSKGYYHLATFLLERNTRG